MKTVTLKIDAAFFENLTKTAKELNITRSEFIRRSISQYEKYIYREKLKANIREASLRVRESNNEVVRYFNSAVGDGLQNI